MHFPPVCVSGFVNFVFSPPYFCDITGHQLPPAEGEVCANRAVSAGAEGLLTGKAGCLIGARLQAISPEPDAGLELTDREIMTWLKSDA